MANVIKTTGSGSPVSTSSTGSDVAAWLQAHTKAVQDAGGKPSDVLTTTWTGGSVPTKRLPNEADPAFLTRHMAAVAAAVDKDEPAL